MESLTSGARSVCYTSSRCRKPSTASPKSMNGTIAVSTWNEIALAYVSRSLRSNPSSILPLRRRMSMQTPYLRDGLAKPGLSDLQRMLMGSWLLDEGRTFGWVDFGNSAVNVPGALPVLEKEAMVSFQKGDTTHGSYQHQQGRAHGESHP